MGGLLTHLSIALIGFLLAWGILKEWKYGLAFAIGHLSPDLIDFGITGLKIGSMNPSVIMKDSWFEPLMLIGHTLSHWIIFGIIVMVILILLYKFKAIEKRTFVKLIFVLVFLLLGACVHLLVDKFVIEHSYWI